MAVVGTYTPTGDWNIETVFTPDATMDNNDKRGCTMWEFYNGTFYHALIFTAFKWEWRTEQQISPTQTIKKWIDFDLDGVATTPYGYAYYKDNLVPITITCTYDYANQERRIYVDGYLLTTDYQNIPAINQALTLYIYTGAASDKFYGTIDSIAWTATAPSPTPLVPPTPQYILTDYNKKYVPGSQNWFPVDDVLVQYQNWPNPNFNITTNCWVEAAYDIQYFAGFNGSTPVPAGVLAKMLLIQALLSSNKWRHSVRFAVLQPAWADKAVVPNTWTTLIGFANANPLVRAILGASVAQVVAIPPNTQPDLHTIPLGTPITAVTGIRNTFYIQIQYILSLLTRPVNGTYVDDEDFSTNTNLQVWPNPAGVNMYVQFINYMFGTPPASNPNTFRGSLPAAMEFIIYDMFDLEHCVSLNQFPFNPLVNVNSTGNASISQYTDRQKFWFLHQGAIRSLRFYLISKYYEIQAGRQLNQVFVQSGRTYEEDGPRPGCMLGLLKMYKVCGAERFYSAYFTPSSIGIQNPKAYCWQAAAASYVEAIFTPPQYRNILLFGTLLDGDVVQFPTVPTSPPLYLFNTGNKLIACSARKYNGEYLIACCYEPLNNYAGHPISKNITVTIEGNVLNLTARKQGSVYHRSATGVLTWLDQWHEDSHFDWWGNVIINPNLNTDMAGINDLHNGLGWIYKTDTTNPVPNIVTVQRNNVEGEREMRRQGVVDSPIGADSAATGLIQITNVASVGNITSITIDGNDILNGSAFAITTAVPATEAEGLALWINGIVPASGYQYFAYSVGDTVYLQSPVNVGLLVNDLTITVVASDVSIVTVTTPFFNGTSATEVYDTATGYKYFLNADYDANGVSGGLPADPDSLTNAYDITKWMITRGNNTGMMQKDLTLVSDAVLSADRGSQNMLLSLTGEGSASDLLVFIAPAGFVEGDLVYIKNVVAGTTITVESAPATTSPSPFKNIYLASDQPYDLTDALNTIMLQYTYDATLGGGIFTEITRSFVYVPPDDCQFQVLSRATALALAGAGSLLPCDSYKITDRGDLGVILVATSTTTFDLHAIHIANYTGGGQVGGTPQEICEYDIVADLFYYRVDTRQNSVRNTVGTASANLDFVGWGYSTYVGNTLNGTCVIAGAGAATATFLYNELDFGTFDIQGANTRFARCVVNDNQDTSFVLKANCYVEQVQFISNRGTSVYSFEASSSLFGVEIFGFTGITFGSSASLQWCQFRNSTNGSGITVNATYSNQVFDYKDSSFIKVINPNGSGDVLLGADIFQGIIKPNATGTIEQVCVSDGAYSGMFINILVKPTTGTTTIVDTSVAALSANPNVRLNAADAGTNIALVAANGDWAQFYFDTVAASPTYLMLVYVNHQNY